MPALRPGGVHMIAPEQECVKCPKCGFIHYRQKGGYTLCACNTHIGTDGKVPKESK